MKLIMLKGISGTGKTTTAEAIIKELRRRGYTVGSVKDIHFDAFTMETEGTNTWRHKQAGSQLVTARGKTETDVLFNHQLEIDQILDFYNQDWVVLEGDSGANCPKILTAHNEEELDQMMEARVIGISGIYANWHKEYKGIPVMDGLTHTKQLVDFIEGKTPERMPNFSEECCSACGYGGCKGLLEAILSGKGTLSQCTLKGKSVSLVANGREIDMVGFVQTILRNVVLSVVKELEGCSEDMDIHINIK